MSPLYVHGTSFPSSFTVLVGMMVGTKSGIYVFSFCFVYSSLMI